CQARKVFGLAAFHGYFEKPALLDWSKDENPAAGSSLGECLPLRDFTLDLFSGTTGRRRTSRRNAGLSTQRAERHQQRNEFIEHDSFRPGNDRAHPRPRKCLPAVVGCSGWFDG